MTPSNKTPVCGLFATADGHMDICEATFDGGRVERREEFRPFLWASDKANIKDYGVNITPLSGPDSAPLNILADFPDRNTYDSWFKDRDKLLPIERISSLENQWLLSKGARLFDGLAFENLRRLQLDIETRSSGGGFPNPARQGDRIIAVGLSGCGGEKLVELSENSDVGERELLETVSAEIVSRNPDVIEGHNIFRFDLDYIRTRSNMLGAKMMWGRFGKECTFRRSRLNIAERVFEYLRCDVPGRTVIDTLILLQLYDVSKRALESYSLKAAAIHFGISKRESRTYIRGDLIGDIFDTDRESFRKYLRDDLRETRGLAYLLLPTFFAQVGNFPLTLQECELRGNGMKVQSVFIEKYYAQKAALPIAGESRFFEGAISRSFRSGVFKNVMHYDVASLYPSIMLLLGECPKNDYLKIFLKELETLRAYRLKYKKLAREAVDSNLRSEYSARQASFKILINSFYGYLGLSTAMFGDSSLAEKVTAKGREILSKLISEFERLGCEILEADTDGIYVSTAKYFGDPEGLLTKAEEILPKGIELDFDGKYTAMLCYKAKNYALLKENGDVILSGSSFRNRGQEPFLRELTESLIYWKLGATKADFLEKLERTESEIIKGTYPVEKLAKAEFLSRSPDVYEREIAATGKGRRAAFEAALMINPRPSSGEKVAYYITKTEKKLADWKRVRPLCLFDKEHPYDPTYYENKISDWRERFSEIDPIIAPEKKTPIRLKKSSKASCNTQDSVAKSGLTSKKSKKKSDSENPCQGELKL